ncbi:MAG TPA: phosphoadenosine phosphosulfate reductase family protein, partial [Verrucomicrobiae bacterium]|nr:phosphoadenosine phosphosulfate reductase family protein [Verrucomicrobiae bacterium]
LSNWTEMDVWEYIKKENLSVPTIYFSHRRRCVRRHGQWLPVTDLLPPRDNEQVEELTVRVRTIGDIISTGMVESPADSVDDIIAEISAARVTERGSRADDKSSEAAMEDRKKAGYF